MTHRTLTLRELNRTTLRRQLLLDRSSLGVPAAIETLVGLQAQVPNPPYIGLWTRLEAFQRETLMGLIESKQVVRAAMMRSTLHLMAAEDFLRLRAALTPALVKAMKAFFGKRIQGLDTEQFAESMRAVFDETPLAFSEAREALTERAPDRDFNALAYVARAYLPLMQLPPGGYWSSGGSPAYATADHWLGRSIQPSSDPAELIRRYLAAFGPASVKDAQAWAGMTTLKDAFQRMKDELVVYRSEDGETLYDLPGLPILDGDMPAPARFIPEYDNLVLAHADRRRVIADAYRPLVYLSAGRVRSILLVDGFMAGTWKIEKAKKAAALVIEPCVTLPAADQAALAEEGERLVRWVEDRAEQYSVRFEPAV